MWKKKGIQNDCVSFAFKYTCYCVGMVSMESVLRYATSASRYKSRSSMYIRGLIPRNWPRQLQLGLKRVK